jgi:hypothetical protein
MYHYSHLASSSPSSSPWDCLSKAYDGVQADDGVQAGSATATAVVLGDGGKGKAIK